MSVKISVITVVYNDCAGLEETIQSVLVQEYELIEYIIIDGGSTDGTLDIIDKYKKHISISISEKDKGIYNAMNKGVLLSRGDWVVFLNAGDVFVDKYVLLDVCKIFDNNYEYYYGDHIGKRDDKIIRYKVPRLITQNIILPNHQAMFIRGDVMKKYGYDEDYAYISDIDLKIKLHENKKGVYLNKDIVVYDMCGVSSNYEDKDIVKKKKREFIMLYNKDRIHFVCLLELIIKINIKHYLAKMFSNKFIFKLLQVKSNI